MVGWSEEVASVVAVVEVTSVLRTTGAVETTLAEAMVMGFTTIEVLMVLAVRRVSITTPKEDQVAQQEGVRTRIASTEAMARVSASIILGEQIGTNSQNRCILGLGQSHMVDSMLDQVLISIAMDLARIMLVDALVVDSITKGLLGAQGVVGSRLCAMVLAVASVRRRIQWFLWCRLCVLRWCNRMRMHTLLRCRLRHR